MKRSTTIQSNGWRGVGHLVAAIGLAALLLWSAMSWAAAGPTLTALAAPPAQGIGPMSNGSVITVGTATFLGYDVGQQQVNGVQLAISQTNAAGGIKIGGIDYTIKLAVADSGCNATQGVTAANELLDAGSVAVVGHTCSSASMPAAPVYNAAGVAMVSPSSTAPGLTRQGYTTTFRTVAHDGSTAMKLGEYFADVDLNRTAILIITEFWSGSMGETYSSTYTALGGTVVSSRTIAATADIPPALTAIQGENADVILVADLIGDKAGEVSRTAYNRGMTSPIAWLGIDDRYITDQAGPLAAEGDFGAVGRRRTSDMPGYAAYEAAYLDANFANSPDDPGPFSPYAYDATNIILEAIRQANTPTDTLPIRDQVAATADFAGVVGTYQSFDAYGDAVPQWGRVEMVENGEWVPARLVAEFYPGQDNTLDLSNSLGQTTTIEIPAGATTETLVVTYTLVATTTNAGVPTLTMVGQHALRLESSVAVSGSMTVTIQYDDQDMAGIDESTLMLYVWDGSQWVDAQPCGGYIRDLDNNILQMIICHFSDYVVLGESRHGIHLPVILRMRP